MIALQTLSLIHRILHTSKPTYISKKISNLKNSLVTRSGAKYYLPNYKLSVSRESFLYQGIKLFNKLPPDIQKEENMKLFKRETEAWIKSNIDPKPLQRFLPLPRGFCHHHQEPQQRNHPNNDIRRYFNVIS